MTGAMTYSTFEILASIEGTTCQNASRGLGMNSSKLKNFLNIVQLKTILEMLTMFLQTLLIRQSWHMEKCIVSRKVQTIKKLFGVLCLINLVLWLGFSVLFDEHLRTMVIESCFYGKPFWRGIRNAIFPLVVFYRFHASMHFYERCKRYHWFHELHNCTSYTSLNFVNVQFCVKRKPIDDICLHFNYKLN